MTIGDLIDSFDPELNEERIYNKSSSIKGAGGQYLYFTHDGRFVFKMMTKSEYELLTDKLFIPYF